MPVMQKVSTARKTSAAIEIDFSFRTTFDYGDRHPRATYASKASKLAHSLEDELFLEVNTGDPSGKDYRDKT